MMKYIVSWSGVSCETIDSFLFLLDGWGGGGVGVGPRGGRGVISTIFFLKKSNQILFEYFIIIYI
jgi:hypothetical protein